MELFYTGKTVEEATAKALEQLGIDREEISVEVVEMPVRKLFRSTPAKIRVTLLAEEEENARKAEAEAAAKAEAEKKAAAEAAKAAKAAAEKAAAEKKAAEKKAAEAKKNAEKKPEKKTEKKVEPKAEIKAEPAVEAAPAEAKEPKEPKELNPEKVQLAKEFLETIAADMGVTGFTVTPEQQDETLVLKVEGENLGILIGRRGETMESLSYLTGLVANRLGGDYQKVALDVAGYRSKRESDLVALAKRVGAKVAKTGRAYTMEPMNPYERRIIHSTISKMEGVSSESTGEGEDRRVVISCTGPNAVDAPARNAGGKNRGGKSGSGKNNGGNRGSRGGKGRGGKGNGNRGERGGERRDAGRTEYKERSREQTAAPVAGERTETVNDAPGISLYGKIEL